MTKKPLYVYVVTVCLLAACSPSAQQASPSKPPATTAPAPSAPPARAEQMPKGTNTNPDAGMVADFKKRVDEYVKLRDDAAKDAPPLKEKATPAEISAAEQGLAKKVRALRQNAKRGDLFTPATQTMFRRLLNPAVKGPDGIENKKAIKDDAPDPKEIPFHVNAVYPKDVPLSTVPPDVLLSLPALPKDTHIEYRFAGQHLLLYDATANLIVDFMLNALP